MIKFNLKESKQGPVMALGLSLGNLHRLAEGDPISTDFETPAGRQIKLQLFCPEVNVDQQVEWLNKQANHAAPDDGDVTLRFNIPMTQISRLRQLKLFAFDCSLDGEDIHVVIYGGETEEKMRDEIATRFDIGEERR